MWKYDNVASPFALYEFRKRILKVLFTLTLSHSHIPTFAQTAQYFRNPIDSPMYLSGNFCQIRDGHFHYGLDIPTNNTEGWPIRAVADGFVSRIFVASYGYGKALFITHPNGLTSVYAHLRNFNAKVDDYTLAQHYKRQSNSLDIFPQKNLLKVKKGDIIAYSGNSGGSTGPHLHFEIRNAANELLNPQFFLDVPDTMPPMIGKIWPVWDGDYSQTEYFKDNIDTLRVPLTEVNIEAEIYDRMIFPENKLAPASYKLYVREELLFECKFDKYSFNENKYANLHFDYNYYWNEGTRLQKCFVERQNKCRFYKSNNSILVKPKEYVACKIIASDLKGNISEKQFVLTNVGFNNHKIDKPSEGVTNVFPNRRNNLYSKDSSVKLDIPFGTFDDTVSVSLDLAPIANGERVIEIIAGDGDKKPFFHTPTLIQNCSKQGLTNNPTKLLFAYIGFQQKHIPIISTYEPPFVKAKISQPGCYVIMADDKAPTIEKDSVSSNYISLKISDDLTGIGYYKATIDGKFALVSYDSKAGKIIFKKDRFTPIGKHEFKLVVGDKKQNYTKWKREIIL